MWQRFTERARRVILLGQEEAGKMNSTDVGPEHLLLGVVRENEGVAAQVLTKMGVSLQRVRQEIEAEVPRPAEAISTTEPKLTAMAKGILELAADEARRMRHIYIGTEHLLLALMREESPVTATVLSKVGLNLEEARAQVIEYLGPGRATGDPPLQVQPFGGGRPADSERVTARAQVTFDVTPEAQLMLERAAAGARILGHRRTDIAHILMAILNLGDAALLVDVDVEATRQRVAEYLKSNQF